MFTCGQLQRYGTAVLLAAVAWLVWLQTGVAQERTITAVSPAQVSQGDTVLLTIEGTDLPTGSVTVEFFPHQIALLDILSAGNGTTVLFSTHITSDLERVADRVAILRDGRIAYSGELGRLKEQVKRLRITSRHNLPASFAVPGALHSEVDGCLATVAVADFQEGLVDALRATWDADVTVTDLNLEEIFVEMHDD